MPDQSETIVSNTMKTRIRAELLAAVPIYKQERQPTYIRIGDIPQPWRDQFLTAIKDRVCPQIPTETNLAYAFYWKDWVMGFSYQNSHGME